MTLEDVRYEMRKHPGEIKAFALRRGSVNIVACELGASVAGLVPGPEGAEGTIPRLTLFGFPIVVLAPDEPEGVIV